MTAKVSVLYFHPDDPNTRTYRDKMARQEVNRIEYKGGTILAQRIMRVGPGDGYPNPRWLIETEWAPQ